MWWGKGVFNVTYSVFPIIQCFLSLRLSSFSIFFFISDHLEYKSFRDHTLRNEIFSLRQKGSENIKENTTSSLKLMSN